MALNAQTIAARISMELTRPAPRDLSTATLNVWNGWLVKLLGPVEQFQTKEKTILANTSLSDAGKAQQLTKVAIDSLPDLQWVGRVKRGLETDLAQQRQDLFTVKPPVKDELLQYHRAREIRDRLAGLNLNERDAAYLTASQQDQPEVMWALLNAPGGSWVSADIRQRADTERAKHAKPDAFAAYTQNEILHERVSGVADHTGQWLKALGVPPADVNATLGLEA